MSHLNNGDLLYQLQSQKSVGAYCLKAILFFCSLFYVLATRIRNIAFNQGWLPCTKLPVPTVALGNITTGGTGKTPAAIFIVHKLRTFSRRKPVLISRGYGNDETRLFHDALPDVPHFVGSKRVLAGKQAITQCGTDICLVLDDAFQHRYIHRDLNIVLIDATNPLGFNYTLPRGFLREPATGLARAGLIIITRSDMLPPADLIKLGKTLQKYSSACQIQAIHAPVGLRNLYTNEKANFEMLEGKRLLALSAIGNPQSFIYSLQKSHLTPSSQLNFSDHHSYTTRDIQQIEQQCLSTRSEGIITTAKDAVKLAELPHFSIPTWILDVAFQIIQGEELLEEMLRSCISS